MNPPISAPTALRRDAGSGDAAARFAERLRPFRQRADRELEAFLAAKRGAAEGTLETLTASIETLIRGGGKRLRPALVFYTHLACGGDREAAALDVALATEMLHAYLLIHDDIMDHAEVRRGEPAAHAQFREQHRARGWPGDAAEFGRAAAILAGDLAHTWAVELYSRGRRRAGAEDGWDAGALDRAFSGMCEEVIGGQFLEMQLPFRAALEDPGEEEILQALHLKSGRYSVERPIELGALLAGADAPTREALGRYGRAAGEAFQLHDDVLGTFGDAVKVGKPVASDLIEGKRTLLIHHTLSQAGEAPRRRLRQLLGRGDLERAEIEEARAIIRDSGGLGRVVERIDRRLAQAREAIAGLELADEGRAFFADMVEYLRQRQH